MNEEDLISVTVINAPCTDYCPNFCRVRQIIVNYFYYPLKGVVTQRGFDCSNLEKCTFF